MIKKLKVSCENVMEKLKFITFIDMFSNFSASNFIWENFWLYLTNARSASNYAFFDTHVEYFPTKTFVASKMPMHGSAFCKQKTRRNLRFWMLRFVKKGSKSLYPNKYTLYSILMHTTVLPACFIST